MQVERASSTVLPLATQVFDVSGIGIGQRTQKECEGVVQLRQVRLTFSIAVSSFLLLNQMQRRPAHLGENRIERRSLHETGGCEQHARGGNRNKTHKVLSQIYTLAPA